MTHARGAASGPLGPGLGLQLGRLALGLMLGCCAIVHDSGSAEATERENLKETGFRPLRIAQSPVRWLPRPDGGPIVLRYAIADRDLVDPEAINCGSMRAPAAMFEASRVDMATFRRALAEALLRWQAIADIAFEPAASLDLADIVVGEQAKPTGRAYTNVTLAKTWNGPARPIVAASICLNPEQPWKVGFNGDLGVYDLVHTLTHEIGHAIGLDHPAGRGHVMSFRYDESRTGLSAGDSLGAVTLYGPRVPAAHASTGASAAAARGAHTRPPADAAELGIR